MNEENKEETVDRDSGDYIFRFQLEPSLNASVRPEDAFHETVRRHLETLLNLVVLMRGDKEIHVDHFRFMNETIADRRPIFRHDQKDTLHPTEL